MNLLQKAARRLFGYNAVQNKDRRQAPQTRVKGEEEVLTASKRTKMLATAQDQVRNLSLVAWMVRKHLDYVSSFHASFRTGIDDLDGLVNGILEWHGSPQNFDFLGRFGRNEMFRFYELEKVVSGDAGLLKLNDLKLQAIESDIIAKGVLSADATETQKADFDKVNGPGLVLDEDGRILQYAICKRGKNGANPIFDHLEDRANMIFDGYWSRFSSQYRGISPLSAAINTAQDISEGLEWNIIKAKMHSLFGVAFLRNSPESGEFGGAGGATAETADAAATDAQTELDMNFRAVNMFDLKDTDKVEILESKTPSTEFVNSTYLYIQIAMLALDIPVTSFDSRRSSFSARIADLNEYEVSVDYKRDKNRHARKAYSDWLLSEIWNNPASEWKLAQTAQRNEMTLTQVQNAVDWIPMGAPWLDKLKQVMGDGLAISLGLDNSIDAAQRRGGDVFENIDKQKKVLNYAETQGVPIATVSTTQRTVEEVMGETETAGSVNGAEQ
jgi:capsid protein